MYFWQALAGVGVAESQAALIAALIDVVPESRLGRAMGWLTLAFQVGFLVGPAVAGVALVNLQTVITASTGLFVAALVMTLTGMPASPGVEIGWNIAAPLRQITRQRAFVAASMGMLGATLLWGTLQAYLPLFGAAPAPAGPDRDPGCCQRAGTNSRWPPGRPPHKAWADRLLALGVYSAS